MRQHVGQRSARRIEILRQHDIEHRNHSGGAQVREKVRQLVELDARQREESAKIKHARLPRLRPVDLIEPEGGVGAERMQITPVLALDQQNHRAARRMRGHPRQAGWIHSRFFEFADQHAAVAARADAAIQIHFDALPDQIDGHIRRTSARSRRHFLQHG